MTKSIIKELYYGNNVQMETIKPTNEYWKIDDKLEAIETKFTNTLNKNQKKLFNKVIDLHYDLMLESSVQHFVEGFKLGLNLGVESSQNSND